MWINSIHIPTTHTTHKNTLVILQHGLGENVESQLGLALYLRNRGYSIGSIEMPGHGGSDGHTSQCNDIREWTSTLIEYIDLCKSGSLYGVSYDTFYLYGHSFGCLALLCLIFYENKLLAKYNIKGILLSSPASSVEGGSTHELVEGSASQIIVPFYRLMNYMFPAETSLIVSHLFLLSQFLPITQAYTTNSNLIRNDFDFVGFLKEIVYNTYNILNTPDQDVQKIFQELPNLNLSMIVTGKDRVVDSYSQNLIQQKLSQNIDPDKFTVMNWTTRNHAYYQQTTVKQHFKKY